MHCTSKMSLIFNNFKLLNTGSVCALYLLFVIILIARFCYLDNLSHSNPQEVIANCKWDKIKEQYIKWQSILFLCAYRYTIHIIFFHSMMKNIFWWILGVRPPYCNFQKWVRWRNNFAMTFFIVQCLYINGNAFDNIPVDPIMQIYKRNWQFLLQSCNIGLRFPSFYVTMSIKKSF